MLKNTFDVKQSAINANHWFKKDGWEVAENSLGLRESGESLKREVVFALSLE